MDRKIHCTYTKDTQVTITAEEISDTLHTLHDKSNRCFTPGDMLAGALGACTLTMMGYIAARSNYPLDDVKVEVLPSFAPDGSGLKSVQMHITFPKDTPEDIRRRCLAAAERCPVKNSLSADIKITLLAD